MVATEDATSPWSSAGVDRWSSSADEPMRHLLVRKGTTYKELQGIWLHTYTGPTVVAEPAWPLGNPNTADPDHPVCVWTGTVELSAEPPGTVSQVLTYLLSLVP